jgi:hypothetical protein
MAPRRTQRIAVHRSKAEEYRSVAENFFGGAEVAKEYAYWNASGAEMRKAMTTLHFTGSSIIKARSLTVSTRMMEGKMYETKTAES